MSIPDIFVANESGKNYSDFIELNRIEMRNRNSSNRTWKRLYLSNTRSLSLSLSLFFL